MQVGPRRRRNPNSSHYEGGLNDKRNQPGGSHFAGLDTELTDNLNMSKYRLGAKTSIDNVVDVGVLIAQASTVSISHDTDKAGRAKTSMNSSEAYLKSNTDKKREE
ncbi:hypothetical protein V6N12_042504 [Hibiscus sabdariffa]|uniref:Uncharacterized protein n=1 Tax=Hibiscus sabdariffa TaxID=183260 RepID=A0ABR2EF00_9ROSI